MTAVPKFLLALCVLAGVPGAGRACGSMCMTVSANQQFTTFQTHINQSMFDKNMKRREDENGGAQRKNVQAAGKQGDAGAQGSADPASIAAEVSYQADPRISEQVKAQVVGELIAELTKRGRHSPENENALRGGLAKIEITQVFAPEVKRFGLAPNNTATAFTAFTSLGFAILNDKDEYSASQNKALYRQISQALAASPSRTSDAEKQKFAETMYWITYMNTLDYGNAKKGTPGYTVANVKASVAQSMKQFRVNPDEIRFGESGLERVR